MRQGSIGVNRLVCHEFHFLSRYDTVIPLRRLAFIFGAFDVLFYIIPFRRIHDVFFILSHIVFHSTMLHAHLIEQFFFFVLLLQPSFFFHHFLAEL